MENEFKHGWVGSVPTMGTVMGFFDPNHGLLSKDINHLGMCILNNLRVDLG